MHRVGHHHAIDDGLDGLRHQRLQAQAFNRHANPGSLHEGGNIACGDHAHLLRFDHTTRGFETHHLPAFPHDVGDFAILDHINTHLVSATRITPRHRIMPPGAAAWLVVGAKDGIPAIGIIVDDGNNLFHFRR